MASKTIKKSECEHISELKIESSEKGECEVCGEKENIRFCTSCGGAFCCESHKAHNKEHFEKTGHPIIKPSPTNPQLDWTWCWKDEAYLEK
jgi:uncharacterized UBP type Zn finger protein